MRPPCHSSNRWILLAIHPVSSREERLPGWDSTRARLEFLLYDCGEGRLTHHRAGPVAGAASHARIQALTRGCGWVRMISEGIFVSSRKPLIERRHDQGKGRG